jgi:hypothetical protein
MPFPSSTPTNDCGGGVLRTTTRPDGTLDTFFSVHQTFSTYTGRVIECRGPGACAVGAALVSDLSVGAAAPVTVREVPRELSVTPTQELTDGQEINVAVSGFPANTRIRIEQCVGYPYEFEFDCGAKSYETVTDANGAFDGTLMVRREFTALGGRHVLCRGPWPCVVGASALTNPSEHDFVPIRFHEVPPTLVASPATGLQDLETVQAVASGFPNYTLVEFAQCRTGSDDCQWLGNTNTDETGTITMDLSVHSVIDVYALDGPDVFACNTAPGACSLRFYMGDNGGEEIWQASSPISFDTIAAPRGTARIDLASALIEDMPVRLEGSGWASGRTLRLMQCRGPGFDGCLGYLGLGTIETDASGAFRVYPGALGTIQEGEPDCGPPENGCVFLVADDNDLSGTTVSIPLNFVELEQVGVTSSYEQKWLPILQEGTRVSGLPPEALQRDGAAMLLWVMTAAGVSTSVHWPRDGVVSYTTLYSAEDYRRGSYLAANFDYTLDELQKAGGLFNAWLKAGMPPLP